jgi:hypothetical protein
MMRVVSRPLAGVSSIWSAGPFHWKRELPGMSGPAKGCTVALLLSDRSPSHALPPLS